MKRLAQKTNLSGFPWQMNSAEHDAIVTFTIESLNAQTRPESTLRRFLKQMDSISSLIVIDHFGTIVT